MLKDGSTAWDIKNFLITQDRCELVTIEGKDYYGKGHPQYEDPEEVGILGFVRPMCYYEYNKAVREVSQKPAECAVKM